MTWRSSTANVLYVGEVTLDDGGYSGAEYQIISSKHRFQFGRRSIFIFC